MDNLSALQLAIKCQLPSVVELLCEKGALMDDMDDQGSCPLWDALDSGQEEIASILVSCIISINVSITLSLYECILGIDTMV